MKKLQLLALSMLLSTAYIAQASDEASPGKRKNKSTENRQNNKGQSKKSKKGKRGNSTELQAEALEAIGGTLDYASLANYAAQVNTALSSLSASSTTDEVKNVQTMLRNVSINLRALNPKAVEEAQL